ncbi:ABC transporter permease [Nocardioides glacieisoli]|uniref:ABC transporter permease n=1 Tax=Nocardioides glacieisoli TaxID=1168730 RepID=A0A4Q2RM66_9ACTN|nr:ABC transporter permease [Nocardioides glacieisoli]RYB89446.1 ABC transporter permease [Nocardioides glacieisoli]
MNGWRPALRIAWRDALRHKGRSILVLVMISLPVLAVSAAAVVIRTVEVTGLEGAERHLGAADARVLTEGSGRIIQAPDPTDGDWAFDGESDYEDPPGEAAVRAVLGRDVRLLPITSGWSRARLDDRVVEFSTTGIDLSDPLAAGLFELEAGRLPEARGEVVVNGAMLEKGFSVGDEIEVADRTLVIAGAGRDATNRAMPTVLGSAADLADEATNRREWLVDAGGPVSWSTVRDLNEIGGVVTSRAVLADPPDVASVAEQLGYDEGQDQTLAILALIVVMALIEVVLLAGPAFAVGARRHARTLALIAASGGTPAQSRRVILGSGVVLGLVASALGLVLGIVAGWALLPVVQRFQGEWFGPFDLPWPVLAAIAAFGLVSALLASVVPAWLASRQDVVAVLAGRRGDRRPRVSTPVLGLVLLGVGIAASAYGAVTSDGGGGSLWIAASAVISVLGMILVVPVVVSTVARLSSRLPLTARYAARDAARHRTRTVPAVAAVAATVAGVVALGIGNASDERQNEMTYTPQAALGTGYVTWGPEVLEGEEPPDPTATWARVEETVRSTAPGVGVRPLRGVQDFYDPAGYTTTTVEPPRELESQVFGVMTYGPTVAVADGADELGIDGGTAAAVDAALGDGRAVLFTTVADTVADVTVRQETWLEDGTEPQVESSEVVGARLVPWDTSTAGAAPAQAVVPPAMAERLGLDLEIASLRLTGDLDPTTETRIKEAVQGAVEGTYVYVERGYQRPDHAVIILLVLGALGGVLMLGGTLTATFLALSDAKPDLATLSAVGAAPRTRRRVAGSYALVIGFVGALLGAGVGFIPGIAISRPLTASFGSSGPGPDGPFLDIPWLLIVAIVVALPLLTAAVVGLSARARLPLVARLD